MERYHQTHDLFSQKVDVANIARQVGMSRQSVYSYLKMTQPPARTRIHRQYKPLIDPYQDYLIMRWNEGCRNARAPSIVKLQNRAIPARTNPSCASLLSFARRRMRENSNQSIPQQKRLSKLPQSVRQRLRRWLIGSLLKKSSAWTGNRGS